MAGGACVGTAPGSTTLLIINLSLHAMETEAMVDGVWTMGQRERKTERDKEEVETKQGEREWERKQMGAFGVDPLPFLPFLSTLNHAHV